MHAEHPGSQRPAWTAHLPAGADPAALDLLAEGTLPTAWARLAAAEPDRPVLHQAGWGWVSRGQLDRGGRRTAAALRDAGLRAGDRVLIAGATSPALIAAHLGALGSGLVVVPVSPADTEPEVARVARSARPAAAVVDDPAVGAWAAAAGSPVTVLAPDVTGLKPGSLLDDDDPETGPEADLAMTAAAPDRVAVDADDPALLVYTSGTTGAPKGAVLTHGNVLASAAAVRLAWRWTDQDRLLLALPLFHVHGLAVGVYGTLLSGGSAVLFPRFDAGEVLAAVDAHGATLLFGVPTMYARLVAHERAAALGRLRLCVSGSAPLAAELFERLAERTGQRVLERYGMTETLMNVSNPYDGDRRPGTVGVPLPGVELRLDDVTGEILLRGPNVSHGYWRDPAATAASRSADGWFRTGDLGRLDDARYLRIEGRRKELIITGGHNVHPREVEEALLAHPQVAEAAVVGSPSDEWGETVTAYVVPAGQPPAVEALLAFVAERLAPYKRPRAVRFVDALPRNALGKLLRHALPR